MAVRKSIRNLNDEELSNLRKAFSEVKNINDERGFEYFAGLHGLPIPSKCMHHFMVFLAWHRAYLYLFELALQDRVPGVAIPWWDWSSEVSHQDGIPTAYADSQVNGSDNPLYSATVKWPQDLINRVRADPFLSGTITSNGQTLRDPDDPDELPRKATIDSIMEESNVYPDFSYKMKNVHNGVHVWTGGAMSQVSTAAYDPIFWSHHCMIDRLWYIWQIKNLGVDPHEVIQSKVLSPFDMTVRDTLNINTLGYEYAVHTV